MIKVDCISAGTDETSCFTHTPYVILEGAIPTYGVGYVTKFAVKTDYLAKFKVENVGRQIHNELWVPAEELEEFNKNIVGLIEVVKEFRK